MSGWQNGGGGNTTIIIPGDTTQPDNPFIVFNKIANVPAGVPTEILSFTALIGGVKQLVRATFTGGNVGTYELLFNGQVVNEYNTYFGSSLSGMWDYTANTVGNGLHIPFNNVISIRVTHNRPYVADFSASFYMVDVL